MNLIRFVRSQYLIDDLLLNSKHSLQIFYDSNLLIYLLQEHLDRLFQADDVSHSPTSPIEESDEEMVDYEGSDSDDDHGDDDNDMGGTVQGGTGNQTESTQTEELLQTDINSQPAQQFPALQVN